MKILQNCNKYFEENQLHAFIISGFRDFDSAVRAVDEFLVYVDNWATCDQMSPKVFAKNTDKLLPCIKKWLRSKHVYTVRFAVLCLMRYYMNANFDTKYADMVLGIKSDEYYVKMAISWLISICYIKYPSDTLKYLKDNKLDKFTHNKAIQKIIESKRVSKEEKDILRCMKI